MPSFYSTDHLHTAGRAGGIIFKTDAYMKLTIKNVKAAKTKKLIIEAPNTDIINKAVCADIEIMEAGSYTEAANGNNISLAGYINGGRENFIIARYLLHVRYMQPKLCSQLMPSSLQQRDFHQR